MPNLVDIDAALKLANYKGDDAAKSANYTTNFRSIQDEVSPEEWQARVDLAACYRLVDAYAMSDLTYNHITVRVPGSDHFLINLYGMLYKEITASSLAKIDLDGNIVWKPETDYGVNAAGYVIHSAIHSARHDLQAVIHTHTRAGMAVAAMDCGLLPVSQHSMRFIGHIGYHDYEGPALSLEERERLLADMGEHRAMILRNHGLLVGAPSVPEAFNLLYQLEMSCRAQVDAMAGGSESLVFPPQDVVDFTANIFAPGTIRAYGLLEWPAMLRRLEAESTGSAYPYYAS
jgi:ribulose-5-phosphate 4-epimerase/fuculose-1-phosphate aldolase